MNEFKKKQWARIGLSLIAVIVAVLFLTGIIGGKSMTYQVEEPLTPMMQGIVDTMAQNAENSEAEDYLEMDPYLVNIYEGFGFAKDYMAARGHAYTLEDVVKTNRPHGKANCITCKTPDFTKMVNGEGVEVYSRPFDEVMSQMTQAISCYTCHGDDKGNNGQIVITHSYVLEALGENASDIDPKVLNCGQCHIEYYFTPEDSETMMPYSSQEEMTPEAILAYYDEIGFKDWEQPGTGTAMLKAQHPEMETFLSSTHSAMGLNCASCHMAEETAEDGSTYHSHYLVSPLQSETLMETCAACHGSADAARTLVTSTQERVTSRETEVGNRLSALKDELTAAVAENRLTEEELATVRQLHREAQWFFDFCYVENSEGAHNSKLSMRCLDTSDEKIAEAMVLLTGEVPEEPAAEEEQTGPDGAMEFSEQGFSGEVTVHLEQNEDQTVKSLTIDTPNETPGLGQRASEEAFTSQFIGKAGPFTYGEDGIEALSGATVTSNAALKAINRAFEGGQTAEETPEEKPAEAPEKTEEKIVSTGLVYGSYVSEKETNFSSIRVMISTKNDEITDCKITSEAKSEGSDFLTDEIRTTWAKAIVENQSAEADAITGATLQFSAGAVKEAVTEIQQQMAAEAAEAPAEEAAPEEEAAEVPVEEAAPEEETAEAPAEETAAKTEEKPASSGLVYGSYLSEKETNFSIIRVMISTKNDEITDCKITSEAKNEGSDFLTDEIRTAWAKAIVENQSAETDAITGATLQFSAGAVKEAVAEIQQQMAAEATEAPAEEAAPEEEAAEVPVEEAAPEEETVEAPAEEAAAKTEEKTVSSGLVYGSYLSEKETNFSIIRVMVSTKNDEITDCKITSEAKSEGSDFLTDEIRTVWAKAIVENQSAETDAITGATLQFSAGAVKEAVAEIQQQMAGEEAAAEEPDEKEAEEAAEEQPAEETVEEEPEAEETKAEEAAEEQPAEESATEEPEAEQEPEAEPEAEESKAEEASEEQPAEESATEEPEAEQEPEAEPEAEEAKAEETAEEQPAEETANAPVLYGTYLAVKETNFSIIRVIISAREGVMTDCRILSEGKSEGSDFLNDEIRAAWAKAIVENQSAETDAITGATLQFSSGAVQEAVNEILQMISGQ